MNASDHNRWSEDLAPYTLGALEPSEAAALERHLEGCERCRGEMRWLEPALQALPEAVERREPPTRLRESLMAEVRRDAAPPKPTASRSWVLKPTMGFAVLALLVAGAVGYEIGRDGGVDSTIVRQVDGITVKMVREEDGGTVELSNLKQLPPGKVLEAWVERDGEVEAVPTLFVPDRHGNAETRIADLSGVETLMVTVEPSGGSDAPTSEPLVTMALPG